MIGKINLYGNGGSSKGIAPDDISNLKVVNKDTKVLIKWTDPENTVVDGETICRWAGTKLVYKQGAFPKSPSDGIQVLDNTEKNKYSENGFEVTNLKNNTKYYFRLFPYTDENVVNMDGKNAFTATPIEIVLNNCTNIKAKAKNSKITVSWSDPDDIIENEETMASWVGTKLVMKQGSYPTNANDGTVIINNTTKNQYSNTPYEIANLTNDTTYYFQLFPYTDVGTYNTSEQNRFEATPKEVTVYGVEREITSSSTTWNRIEGSEGLVANATHDGTAVQNDFDNLYPWSDIITVDLAADGTINSKMGDADFSLTNPKGYIMTYVPAFWYKRVQENGYERIYIADNENEDFIKSEEFYIGRYTAGGTTSAINSKSGIKSLVNTSIVDFRTAAKKVGNNWGQLDILRWSVLQMLYLVEYADYDSQTKLGQGVSASSNSAQINNGGCDTLQMKSGCLANAGKTAVIYRGIENIFGNIFQWCDGVNIKSRRAWISKNPSDYVSDKFASPYTQLGYVNPSSDNYISKIGYDLNLPEVQLPIEASGSSTTKIPDYYWQNSSSVVVAVGGYWHHAAYCGLWYWHCDYASSYTYSYFGRSPSFHTSTVGVWGRPAPIIYLCHKILILKSKILYNYVEVYQKGIWCVLTQLLLLVVAVGGNWNNTTNCGLWYWNCNYTSSNTNSNYGRSP